MAAVYLDQSYKPVKTKCG